jgi:hypothetical protein
VSGQATFRIEAIEYRRNRFGDLADGKFRRHGRRAQDHCWRNRLCLHCWEERRSDALGEPFRLGYYCSNGNVQLYEARFLCPACRMRVQSEESSPKPGPWKIVLPCLPGESVDAEVIPPGPRANAILRGTLLRLVK